MQDGGERRRLVSSSPPISSSISHRNHFTLYYSALQVEKPNMIGKMVVVVVKQQQQWRLLEGSKRQCLGSLQSNLW
jgi:hypothetical protein